MNLKLQNKKCTVNLPVRFLVLILMSMSSSLSPQAVAGNIEQINRQQEVQKKVTIHKTNVPVQQLLNEIKRQTGMNFIMDASVIRELGNGSLTVSNLSISETLDKLLAGTPFMYKINGNSIAIVKREQTETSLSKRVKVSGRVVGEDQKPISGVNVVVKGNSRGVTTDPTGNFTIEVHKGEVIGFSFVGMVSVDIPYTGQPSLSVVMKEDVRDLERIVVNTGYETIDPRKSTSAIQTLKANEIVVPGLTSIDNMLEGYVPGMIFMQNSGQVGVTPRLRIRGTSTVLGSQEPLWVVDGIVQENPVNVDPQLINDLDFVNLLGNAISGLNPQDIEQIDILKDASATALYGARAANGVIVITTKRGKEGPPRLTYSMSTSFASRPHYSDRSVYMMNSQERIDFSRDLIEKRVSYPKVNSEWLGYEKPLYDYWQGRISFAQMQQEVGQYESQNTDWFDILMQNSFSHKHTLSLSGGSSNLGYYVSVGMSDMNGNIKDEKYKQYTANFNLTANYKKLSIRFSMNGNVGNKDYTPTDVEVTKYAMETTRVLPAYNDDGSLWYYLRSIGRDTYRYYNIVNEIDNSSLEVRNNHLSATATIDYKINSYLKASVTGSYTVDNTTQETWHGENTFYAELLRQPIQNGADQNSLPVGGEMIYQNSEHYAYTVRGQLNFNKYLDLNERHLITASTGGEVSSNQYYGLGQTYRGYLKERGKKMAQVSPIDYEWFAQWLGTNSDARGEWTDKLTNVASAYGTISYTYNDLYTVNANVRIDASNRFGSRANEQLTPIWSLSARWDIKNDLLTPVRWVNSLSLRGSFGYQGNMHDSQSAKLVLQRGGIDADFKEYESSVVSFPNPDLRWEKTASYNASLDFGLFNNRISGSLSYFYKNTRDAFLNKQVSTVNGVSDWVVNQGTLENHGLELSMRIKVLDLRRSGFSWTISPNIGQILNKLTGGSTDKSLTNQVSYERMLNGTLQITGRPLNSFYSYRYLSLDSQNGIPIFYGSNSTQYIGNEKVNLAEKYKNMELIDIYTDVMEHSGCRVPKIQGGLQNSFSWKRFSVSMNLTYSFGSHIRLLSMYADADSRLGTIAPQPSVNVRKEFVNRWRQPGDELKTDIPGVVSSTVFNQTLSSNLWWSSLKNMNSEKIAFADNLWTMYDNSNLRTVSGNFVKIQSLSVRYSIPQSFCDRLMIKDAYVGFSGTNLHTFCSKKLQGQDPATQDGNAPTVTLSLRPTYSFTLNVSF